MISNFEKAHEDIDAEIIRITKIGAEAQPEVKIMTASEYSKPASQWNRSPEGMRMRKMICACGREKNKIRGLNIEGIYDFLCPDCYKLLKRISPELSQRLYSVKDRLEISRDIISAWAGALEELSKAYSSGVVIRGKKKLAKRIDNYVALLSQDVWRYRYIGNNWSDINGS